jgi:hypothetical protein
MRIKPALLACFLLLTAAPLVAQQSGSVPPPHQPTALQRTPKQPIQSAVERRCRQFSAPELSQQVLEASDQEISALEELAEQCVDRGSRQTRLAAFKAYRALVAMESFRVYDPLLTQSAEEAERAKGQLKFVIDVFNDQSKQNQALLERYNHLVARYEELRGNYRELMAASKSFADDMSRFLASELARSEDTRFLETVQVLSKVSMENPPKPLYCTARTYDWGITPVTTYIDCH